VKQYSDMPPPPSVPASRILKQGVDAPSRPSVDEAPATATQAASAEVVKPPMTIAERNADFRKRHAEQAEKEKKAAEQARITAEKKKNCEHARDYQTTLTSGERIAHTDRNGERSFLTDEQRAQEMKDVNRVLQECK
jgi:tRNA nucleotidyltransferase (CCA-adding enzyme)